MSDNPDKNYATRLQQQMQLFARLRVNFQSLLLSQHILKVALINISALTMDQICTCDVKGVNTCDKPAQNLHLTMQFLIIIIALQVKMFVFFAIRILKGGKKLLLFLFPHLEHSNVEFGDTRQFTVCAE